MEQMVFDYTLKMFDGPETISKIADEIIQLHNQMTKEQSILHLLNEERAKLQKSLNNLMIAIEEGVLTPTTKARVNELEALIAETDMKIFVEQSKLERTLKKDDVEKYIIEGLQGDGKALIESLIDKVVLYEDKIEITYKYTNNNPDDFHKEVHRDFLLYGLEMKITQSGFSVIFEL